MHSGLLIFISIMPTVLEGGPDYNKLIFNYDRSWTDDLPICKVSGTYTDSFKSAIKEHV